ncbi:hypothetical protein AAFX91_32325 [Bradyrhizobium sp. 31Argb]|uniref:hypothetical protein n=1 Tax=Bradyrhizobium sp. 31Argb TaxID=3141247 RepID=UPI003749759C
MIDRGAIVPVPRGSAGEVYADAILAAAKRPPPQAPFDFTGWWRDVATTVAAVIYARKRNRAR